MAKKRITPADAPSFVVVHEDGSRKAQSAKPTKKPASKLQKPKISVEYLLELFTDCDFNCLPISEQGFIALDEDQNSVSVILNKNFDLISLLIPLVFKSNISKARKLEWINRRMITYPYVRLYVNEDGTGTISYEYLYKKGFNEDNFLALVSMYLTIAIDIYQEDNGEFLKKVH